MAIIKELDLASVTIGRGAIYEYLSLIFSGEITREFIGLTRKFTPVFKDLAQEYGSDNMAKSADDLKKYAIYENQAEPNLLLIELNKAYTSLYLIGASCVAPTESVNRTVERINRQEPWEQVMEFYRLRNFKPSKSFKEPEDHISTELKFMQVMCYLSADLLKEGRNDKAYKVLQEQEAFISKHLELWVPKFCNETIYLAKRDGFPLYGEAAGILKNFIAIDKDLLNSIV